jgi:hypothetical protein
MEGESAFGYLNPALELDLSEYSRRLEKRCEDASHSNSEDVREAALRAKVIRSLIRFVPQSRDFWSAHSLPARVRASSRRFDVTERRLWTF